MYVDYFVGFVKRTAVAVKIVGALKVCDYFVRHESGNFGIAFVVETESVESVVVSDEIVEFAVVGYVDLKVVEFGGVIEIASVVIEEV